MTGLTHAGVSREKLSLIDQIGRMYTDYFGVQVRRPLSYQWRMTSAFELRRICANWQLLFRRRAEASARRESKPTLFQ